MEPLAGAEALTRYIEAKRLERLALRQSIAPSCYAATTVSSLNAWFETVQAREADEPQAV